MLLHSTSVKKEKYSGCSSNSSQHMAGVFPSAAREERRRLRSQGSVFPPSSGIADPLQNPNCILSRLYFIYHGNMNFHVGKENQTAAKSLPTMNSKLDRLSKQCAALYYMEDFLQQRLTHPHCFLSYCLSLSNARKCLSRSSIHPKVTLLSPIELNENVSDTE